MKKSKKDDMPIFPQVWLPLALIVLTYFCFNYYNIFIALAISLAALCISINNFRIIKKNEKLYKGQGIAISIIIISIVVFLFCLVFVSLFMYLGHLNASI